ESFEIFRRQRGPLDPRDHRLVGKRIKEREGAEIGKNAAPFEKKCIRLDSIEQCGCQSLRRLHPDGPQILCEDRGRRAISGSKVGKTSLEGGPLRMMIYYQIDSSEGLVKIGRLDVNQSQPRSVFVQILIGDPIDLNIQETDHRKILWPSHFAESHNRGSNAIAAQQFAQGQRAADGVGIWVVLEQDVNLFLTKKRTNPFDFFSVQCIEQPGGTKLFEDIRQLELAKERILGLFCAI